LYIGCSGLVVDHRTRISGSYGPITSAIKLAINLTIKLETYNKQHFVVATTKMLMRAATVIRRRQLRSIAVAAQIPRLSIVMGAGSGGDAGQLTRSPGSNSASLSYIVTVDNALAIAQLLQPSLAFLPRNAL